MSVREDVLKQLVRRVHAESPDAVYRGYVFCDPDTGELSYMTAGARRSVGYVVRKLKTGIGAGAIILGAFAFNETQAGGTLNFRTSVQLIPLGFIGEVGMRALELAAIEYAKERVPDKFVYVAARAYDAPATKSVQ